MSNEDFKDRIRRILGVPEGAGKKGNPCVVRKAQDWYKPKQRKSPNGKTI